MYCLHIKKIKFLIFLRKFISGEIIFKALLKFLNTPERMHEIVKFKHG